MELINARERERGRPCEGKEEREGHRDQKRREEVSENRREGKKEELSVCHCGKLCVFSLEI